MRQAIFEVMVGGQSVTDALRPVLISLSVSDNAGSTSDSATFTLDDKDGALIMPAEGARMTILLGWEGEGAGIVFEGTVDDVRASGSRGGRELSINARGMDTRSKAKEGQRLHFDDTTIGQALTVAGQKAGISVFCDEVLGSIKRGYIALDDESFVAFGERLAREIGGTFKIVGDRAILAKRNGGRNARGAALPTVTATWGQNLHDYDLSPIMGRAVEKETASRWFDPKSATWRIESGETGTGRASTRKVSRWSEADQDSAKEKASADAAESDRKSGEGSVTIEGNIAAQPEGECVVSGCRPGIDGTYRIEAITHDYSRSGFMTRLELCQPKGNAGEDRRVV